MSNHTVKTKETGSQERLASHTPGPWEYGPAHNYSGFYIAPRGRLPTLAAVEEGKPHVHAFNFPGATEANARLIAAAPELLAVCETIASGKGGYMPELRAAIAKARHSEQRSPASNGSEEAR